MKVFALLLVLAASEYPQPNIREEQQVVVNGVAETWRLEWKTPPNRGGCFAHYMAITCPCQGFAYSENGDLDLVRLRAGDEVDRLHLNPLFTEIIGGGVMLQRWPIRESDTDDTAVSAVTQRETVRVMRFADYDHDGSATEFYLQTEAMPCGKSQGVVIGVSKSNPRLHAFGTASQPGQPLYLQKREWEALRGARGPVETLDWLCGDHGAENETTALLSWGPRGINVSEKTYSCPGGRKSGKLLK